MSSTSHADERKRCTNYGCNSGYVTEMRTETDYSTGIALGTALGMGFFPSTKTVTERKPCPCCHGTGYEN